MVLAVLLILGCVLMFDFALHTVEIKSYKVI